jgi:hypothetical protein
MHLSIRKITSSELGQVGAVSEDAVQQPLGTIKNKKGHHLNTPPLWEESRAQHCQAKRYSWAIKTT